MIIRFQPSVKHLINNIMNIKGASSTTFNQNQTMKNVLTLLLILSVSNIWASKLSNCPPLHFISAIKEPFADKDMVLNMVIENGHRLLRVSLNSYEGTEGELRIYNAANEQKGEFYFELIKYPHYATVDITDLVPGNYTVKLTTKIAAHTAVITVQ